MKESLIGIFPLPEHVLVDIRDKSQNEIDLGGGKKLYTLADDTFDGYRNANLKHRGIRPRTAHVIALSEEAAEADIHLGDEIVIDTLKWSRKVPFQRDGFGSSLGFWRVNIDDILLVNHEQREAKRKEFVHDYKKELGRAQKAFPSVRR